MGSGAWPDSIEPLYIELQPRSVRTRAVLAGLFVLYGCWFATLENPPHKPPPGLFHYVFIFGLTGLAPIAGVTIWIAPHYVRHALIIDADGLWDPRVTRKPIRWSEIRAIFPRFYSGDGTFTPRDLIQVDLYPEARRRLRRSRWRIAFPIRTWSIGWDAIVISTADTLLSFDDLCREMKARAGPLWRDHI